MRAFTLLTLAKFGEKGAQVGFKLLYKGGWYHRVVEGAGGVGEV